MKPRLPRARPSAIDRAAPDTIEWEELPSLVGRLHAATANAAAGRDASPAWEVTMPAALDTALPADPFLETLQGLAVREVREPDVFRYFFTPR